MPKPNILLITTDQQRWDALSLLGTPGYRTPHLDRLAREGLSFDRCYTTSPICTPARVSMITGQYPSRHGAYSIGMRPAPSLEGATLPRQLSRAGYETAIVGKTHFVARHLEHRHVAGWDIDRPDEPGEEHWKRIDGPYLGFDLVRHCSAHTNDRAPAAHYRRWLQARGEDVDHLHRIPGDPLHNAGQPIEGLWGIDPESTQNGWIADEVQSWIAGRQPGRPWFCMANFQDPHPPYVCPDPYFSSVNMDGVDLGDPSPDYLDDRPPFYRRFIDRDAWDDVDAWSDDPGSCYSDGILLPATATYGFYKDPVAAIRAYIGMTTMVDHFIGRILLSLEASGMADNTLILFTSDHGELLGRHGMWWKGLPAFDDCQRVPCIMRWPAAQRGPIGRCHALCSLVDLMPTALEAAGIELPPGVQGVSQLPVIRGSLDRVRDWALVDYLATVNRRADGRRKSMHQQTLIVDGWKIVCYGHAAYGELYDLETDPDQRRNRWDERAVRDLRERLLLKLVQVNMSTAGVMPQRVAMA